MGPVDARASRGAARARGVAPTRAYPPGASARLKPQLPVHAARQRARGIKGRTPPTGSGAHGAPGDAPRATTPLLSQAADAYNARAPRAAKPCGAARM